MELFFGRQKEVQKLLEQINTPGQHSLLYGERGVGKSSLANIATQVLISKLISGKLFTKRCDSSDNFLTIVAEPLRAYGVEIETEETTSIHKQRGGAGLKIPVISADLASERTTQTKYKKAPLTPSTVAEVLKDKEALLYIDEADRLKLKKDKVALAELIKHLSDEGSPFKVLVVGVAETADELTGGHPSVQRCLKETQLRRMRNEELAQIIEAGSERVRLRFDSDVIKLIVQLSSGYPHFTHLLALKCAENAIASKRNSITREVLADAITEAVEDAEGSLRRKYLESTRSHSTEMYRIVLNAAAKLEKTEFTAAQLRQQIASDLGESISQGALNNYLRKLVSDDFSCVLHRTAQGVYKFADPRMPSFIRISNYAPVETS
jgi:Cdc6-like AAA superfamily ATPase